MVERKDILLLDAGDLLYSGANYGQNPDASLDIQGRRIIDSLNAMGWTALGLGENEFALGLDYLKDLEDMADFPFLSANVLYDKDGSYVFTPYLVKNLSGFRVGITAVIGGETEFRKQIGEDGIYLESETAALKKVLRELEGKSDFIIVLSHTGFREAEKLAQKFDGVDLFIVGHRADYSHNRPSKLGSSLLVQGLPRGQYIHRLDISIQNPQRPYMITVEGGSDMRSAEYHNKKLRLQQLLRLYEDIQKTKKAGKDPGDSEAIILAEIEKAKKEIAEIEGASGDSQKNTIRSSTVELDRRLAEDPGIKKIEDHYKKNLVKYVNKTKMDKLEKGERDPRELSLEPHYVGAESCVSCHKTHYKFWEDTKHAVAFETLVKEERQCESDCIRCHTTGFRKFGGFKDILTAKDLLGVQCETCHGPGSLHISKGVTPHNLFVESTCLSCHDPENDDDFQYERDLAIIRCPEED